MAEVVLAEVLQGAGDAFDGGDELFAVFYEVGAGALEIAGHGAEGEERQAHGEGDACGLERTARARRRPRRGLAQAERGRQDIGRAERKKAPFHAEKRQEDETGGKGPEHGPQGVGHGHEAGRARPVAHFAVEGFAERREDQARDEGGREHQGKGQHGHIAPVHALVDAKRHPGRGFEQAVGGQGGGPDVKDKGRGDAAAVGLAAQPPARERPAEADAGQDHGEHHGEGQARGAHEKLEKPGPDDFEAQKGRAGQEAGGKQPSGAGGQRRRGGLGRVVRASGLLAEFRGNGQRAGGGQHVEPGGEPARSRKPERRDEQRLAEQCAEAGPERIDAVQPAEGEAEFPGAAGQGLDQKRQGHAHGRGRQQKKQE